MKLALVPLDDRPCNFLFPQRLAETAGVELALPPRELLGSFLTPGQPDRVMQWLLDVSADSDAILLCADMLLYGGLIASRTPAVTPAVAETRVRAVGQIKARRPTLPVFCSSVITRITVTGSDRESLQWYEPLFRLSQLLDETRSPAEVAERARLQASIPSALQETYLAVRRRNHLAQQLLIQAVAAGWIDSLMLTQEDCALRGIHRAEQHELIMTTNRLGVGDRVFLYPGADESGMMLLARALRWKKMPALYVQPHIVPPAAEAAVPAYEDRPLGESLASQMAVAGLQVGRAALRSSVPALTAPGSPDAPLQLLLYSMPPTGTAGGATSFVDETLTWVQARLKAGVRVGIADIASPNGADPGLVQRLYSRNLLGKLDAFGGWNTAGNSLGTALAELVCAHYAAPRARDKRPLAHYRFLFERLVDDWIYQAIVRPGVNEQLLAHQLLPGNVGEHKGAIETEVRKRVIPAAQQLFTAQFQGVECREGVLESLESLDVKLPWPRTFEVELSAEIRVAAR